MSNSKVSALTAATVVNNTDLLYLSQGGQDRKVTKDVLRGYKVYTALLSQVGTNDPVASVLENTLGGEIVWTRFDFDGMGDAKGQYVGTLAGAFSDTRTFILLSIKNTADSSTGPVSALYLTANTIGVRAYIGGTLSDYEGTLYIEIRAYQQA